MTIEPPDDPVSLSEVIAGYGRDGYGLEFFVTDDGLRGPDGGIVAVDDVAIHSLRRLEGASDPVGRGGAADAGA
jgi:hypothetical protein